MCCIRRPLYAVQTYSFHFDQWAVRRPNSCVCVLRVRECGQAFVPATPFMQCHLRPLSGAYMPALPSTEVWNKPEDLACLNTGSHWNRTMWSVLMSLSSVITSAFPAQKICGCSLTVWPIESVSYIITWAGKLMVNILFFCCRWCLQYPKGSWLHGGSEQVGILQGPPQTSYHSATRASRVYSMIHPGCLHVWCRNV